MELLKQAGGSEGVRHQSGWSTRDFHLNAAMSLMEMKFESLPRQKKGLDRIWAEFGTWCVQKEIYYE